jgi:hypothetical protein
MLYNPLNKIIENKIKKYSKDKKIIFVSQSSSNICWTRLICKFVLSKGHVPVNYFTVFFNFVHEIADLKTMIDSINSLIVRCDELWSFGEISEGMWYEIGMCKDLKIPIKYFNIEKLPNKIKEIKENEVKYSDKFSIKMKKFKKFKPINKLNY